MDRKVTTILRIWARAGEREPASPVAIDLQALVAARARAFGRRAGERGLELRAPEGARRAVVECDASRLEAVLDVLLDNAVEHGSPGGPITWSIELAADGAAIEIRNAQVGLAAADAELVLEPFWSSAAARGASRHCGLGLALARSLCVPPELDLRIEIPPGRFVARVAVRGEPRDPAHRPPGRAQRTIASGSSGR
jgi:signal transduction histidine kinase